MRRCSWPAGSRSCPATCPPTGSGWWTGRSRGSSPGSRRPGPRGRGGEDHRGRPRPARRAGRGRAAPALRVLVRTDEYGLRTVIARVEAGDAVWVEAILARVAEIIAPRHPDAAPTRSGPSRSGGWPAPPSSSSCCSSTARTRRSSTSSHAEHGRRRSPPTCSTRSAPWTCPRSPPRRSSTSTSTRPPSTAPRRGPGRRPRAGHPDRAQTLLARTAPHRQAGHRPVRPGPDHRLRTPRIPQGTGPPDHRRRLLALRHLDQPLRRPRPPDPVRRHRARRARPAPTTPAPWAGDITAGRPMPATAPDSAEQAGTSG